jgi:ATP-dependent Lon protease
VARISAITIRPPGLRTRNPSLIAQLLGPERFSPEQARKDVPAGVAIGLAWTEAGGDVL